MGNLGRDTAVEQIDEHRYRATLDKDWEIWGPCGGYTASVALRAVGASSAHPRPASFFCHYLSVPAVWQQWIRFLEGDFDDPWVDACRSLVLVDVQSWPAASRPHVHREHGMYAPSLDLYVALHRRPAGEWLLTDGVSPVGESGLLG